MKIVRSLAAVAAVGASGLASLAAETPSGIDSFSRAACVCCTFMERAEHPAHADQPSQPSKPEGETTGEPAVDWRAEEGPFLTGHVQLTFPNVFSRAGEAYFDATSTWVIFQAIPRARPGDAEDKFYSMYVARLTRDARGNVTGLDEPIRLSPEGSANTCGWFHPAKPWIVLFGSTLVTPSGQESPGYSRDRSRYQWEFPRETEVVSVAVEAIWRDFASRPDWKDRAGTWTDSMARLAPIFERPGYDAEGSWSPDGRFILYTHVDPSDDDPNLWAFDTKTATQTPLVMAKGYDGGPFFSPDGSSIIYRSDRRGNNLLQVYRASLAFGADCAITGITNEEPLTEDEQVNWCPFFDPTSRYVIFATSREGHTNYEVFALEAGPNKPPFIRQTARVTYAEGFDGLPVFNPDGSLMMWTSQRGPRLGTDQRPTSQIWIAKVTGQPRWDLPKVDEPDDAPKGGD